MDNVQEYNNCILGVFYEAEMSRLVLLVKLVTNAREMAGSNTCWGTNYPERVFSWVPSAPPRKCRDNTSFRSLPLPYT
jgi:hypothetical protein